MKNLFDGKMTFSIDDISDYDNFKFDTDMSAEAPESTPLYDSDEINLENCITLDYVEEVFDARDFDFNVFLDTKLIDNNFPNSQVNPDDLISIPLNDKVFNKYISDVKDLIAFIMNPFSRVYKKGIDKFSFEIIQRVSKFAIKKRNLLLSLIHIIKNAFKTRIILKTIKSYNRDLRNRILQDKSLIYSNFSKPSPPTPSFI